VGGFSSVRLLPDPRSVHRFGPFSKWVPLVRRSNPRFAWCFNRSACRRAGKKGYFSSRFGVARFGVPISAWPEVSYALLPAGDGGPGWGVQVKGTPKRRKSAGADLGGGQRPQSALLESQGAFGRKACAARAFAAAQASAVAMTKDEERELREQLARLQQEHRDLDAAISALQHSPGSDLLQVQRLKKRKLHLRDRISYIEDQLTPDIIA